MEGSRFSNLGVTFDLSNISFSNLKSLFRTTSPISVIDQPSSFWDGLILSVISGLRVPFFLSAKLEKGKWENVERLTAALHAFYAPENPFWRL